MKREEILQAWLNTTSNDAQGTIVEFAAIIARKQREADLHFMKTRGRALPATCQQKAIIGVREALTIEKLITE